MPTHTDETSGRAPPAGEDRKAGLLRDMGLLALPVVAFHRNMLGVLRTGIQEAGLLKPVQTLVESELHTLMMVLDPSGEWRNSRGADIEKKLKDTLDAAVPKAVAGAVSLIDAQYALLTALLTALDPATSNTPSKKKRGS